MFSAASNFLLSFALWFFEYHLKTFTHTFAKVLLSPWRLHVKQKKI